MKLDEAIKKYGIPVPKDIENYDKEIYKEFDNMYLESLYSTFYSMEDKTNEPKGNGKVAVVLGGQTGAGKSSLIADTKRNLQKEGRRIVVIDDDQYRKLYPYGKEILRDCPEHYTKVTAIATSLITPKILKFVSENGYNFIFDGTMKNPRILNTMQTWDDYKIYVKIMAASRPRSLASIAIRNGELRKIGEEGRYIPTEDHDATYYGIPETLEMLEKLKLAEEIKIYTRGENALYPNLEFSSKYNKEISSVEKLRILRQRDAQKFIETAEKDINYLKELANNLSATEKEEIYKTIGIIQNEYLNKENNAER